MRWPKRSGRAQPIAATGTPIGSSTSRPPARSATKPRGHPEDDLQEAIIQWHARWIDQADAILFAVPNGERRDAKTAARLSGMSTAAREELPEERALTPAGLGVLPGVSDLVVLLSQGRLALVEVKIAKIVWPPVGDGLPLFSNVKRVVKHVAGRLSKVQLRFQKGAVALGHDYRVIRSVDEYRALLAELGVPVRPAPQLGL